MTAASKTPAQPDLLVANGVRRLPTVPTLIEPLPTGLTSFPSVDAMADHAVALFGGRPVNMAVIAQAAYPGFDTFPIVNLYDSARTFMAAVALDAAGGFDAVVAALEAAATRSSSAQRGSAPQNGVAA